MVYKWTLNTDEVITFLAPDFQAASLATLLVSQGQYGATRHDGLEIVPAFPNGGDGVWLETVFGMDWRELFHHVEVDRLAGTLRSFTCCGGGQAEAVRQAHRWAFALSPDYGQARAA
jgi:hypothetical protein